MKKRSSRGCPLLFFCFLQCALLCVWSLGCGAKASKPVWDAQGKLKPNYLLTDAGALKPVARWREGRTVKVFLSGNTSVYPVSRWLTEAVNDCKADVAGHITLTMTDRREEADIVYRFSSSLPPNVIDRSTPTLVNGEIVAGDIQMPPSLALDWVQFRPAAGHGMRHALGVFFHSEEERDLMHPWIPRNGKPTQRDRNTMAAIYSPEGAAFHRSIGRNRVPSGFSRSEISGRSSVERGEGFTGTLTFDMLSEDGRIFPSENIRAMLKCLGGLDHE